MAKQAAARRINGVVGSSGSITPSTPRAIERQPTLINRVLMVWCFINFFVASDNNREMALAQSVSILLLFCCDG